jgi:hypothetical protein
MTVATRTLIEDDRLVIVLCTNDNVSANETAALKVDVTTLAKSASGLACTGVKINKIWSTTHGMEIQVLWDATTDVFAWAIPQNTNYLMDFSQFGGLTNNAGAGKTGNILFTTLDGAAGDMYSVILECIKTYG